MKRYIPWLTLGLLGAVFGGSTFACSSDSGGGSGGSGATASGGSGGSIVGGTGGVGATDSGVGGSTGGTGGTTSKLGAKCTKDAECGTGLTCLLANSGAMDGEGPAKGLCTTECSADPSVCGQFGTNVTCLTYDNGKGYCMEGCTFGDATPNASSFDSKKCHGRQDMVCNALLSSEKKGACSAPDYECPKGEACATDNTCHPIASICTPRCNVDAECGSGLKCNPKTGLCTSQPITGKTLGEACTVDEDAGTNDCQGVCLNFGDNLRSCAQYCPVGANPSCGWSDTTKPAPSMCLYGSTIVADNSPTGEVGLGDLGFCIQFCDCNSDCKNPGMVCSDFGSSDTAKTIKNFTKRQGACFNPKNSQDGAIDPGIPTCGGSDAGTGGTGGTGGSDAGSGDASTD